MTQKKPIDWKTWLLLLAAVRQGCSGFPTGFSPCFATGPDSDLSIHMTWAGECSFSDWRSFFHHAAHPMWHMLVTLAKAAVRIFRWSRPPPPLRRCAKRRSSSSSPCCFSGRKRCGAGGPCWPRLCCVLVASLRLAFYNPTVYLGVGTPNTWHSPTQMISMVWMLLCVPYVARCYDDGMALTGTASIPG